MYVTKKLKNPYSKDFKFVLNNIFWKAFFNFCCFQTVLVGRLEGWKARRLESWKVRRLKGWKVQGFFCQFPCFQTLLEMVGSLEFLHNSTEPSTAGARRV